MNGDLISREEAIELIRSLSISIGGKEIFQPEAKKSVIEALDLSPTVDAAPVVHGRWISRMGSWATSRCSICRWKIPYSEDSDLGVLNYCPNCGAKMDLKGENEA